MDKIGKYVVVTDTYSALKKKIATIKQDERKVVSKAKRGK